MVEGGMSCVKYLLFAFNFLFFIVGLALIICGAVIQGAFSEYFEIIGGQFNAAAVLLIIVGSVIFIIGFFGCCGAVKENYCMVMTFAVLLCIIFILEIAAGITAFAAQTKVEGVVKEGLTKSMDKYKSANATRAGWDSLQQNLECCGIENGYKDWAGKLDTGKAYPNSCCKKEDQSNPGCGTAPGLAFPTSCVPKLKDYVSGNVLWIGVVGICLSFVQIVGVIFACCLGRAIKKEYEVV